MYFKYTKVDNPVRIGFIGTGDEGGVLIGALTPDYVQVAAIADIRPYNVHRAFHGDWSSDNAIKVRTGLMNKYGWKTEDEARKNVKVYGDYNDLIADKDKLGIEAVIIALPLHLHAPVGHQGHAKRPACAHRKTDGLQRRRPARKWDASRSKPTNCSPPAISGITASCTTTRSIAFARDLIGDVHCIRAQWHRKADTWSPPVPGVNDTKPARSWPICNGNSTKLRPRIKKNSAKLAKLRAKLGDSDVKLADQWVSLKKKLDTAGPKEIDLLAKTHRAGRNANARCRREGGEFRLSNERRWPTAIESVRWKNSSAGGCGNAPAAA